MGVSKKRNKDVPVEIVVKYIVQERDKYKEKLHSTVEYAKAREKYLQEEKKREIEIRDAQIKHLENLIKSLEGRVQKLTIDNGMLVNEYKKSDWYKQLHNQNKKLRDKVGQWRMIAHRAIIKLVPAEQLQKEAEELDNDCIL